MHPSKTSINGHTNARIEVETLQNSSIGARDCYLSTRNSLCSGFQAGLKFCCVYPGHQTTTRPRATTALINSGNERAFRPCACICAQRFWSETNHGLRLQALSEQFSLLISAVSSLSRDRPEPRRAQAPAATAAALVVTALARAPWAPASERAPSVRPLKKAGPVEKKGGGKREVGPQAITQLKLYIIYRER